MLWSLELVGSVDVFVLVSGDEVELGESHFGYIGRDVGMW